MKDFRKTENGFFICERCYKIFKLKHCLTAHINKHHHNQQEYYNKYLKEDNENICKICRKENEFTGFKRGYKNCCSKECRIKYTQQRIKEEIFKKYRVENAFQLKKVKEKSKQTMLKNHGVEHALQSDKIKEKYKQTMLKNHGVEYSGQSKEIQEKYKQTCLKNNGVEYPSQNIEILNRTFKTRIQLHNYKNTKLTYQGSYEKDFLDKFYEKIDIENGPSVKYRVKNKNKVYHSDFYILSLNLIVEIKSS